MQQDFGPQQPMQQKRHYSTSIERAVSATPDLAGNSTADLPLGGGGDCTFVRQFLPNTPSTETV